MTDLEDENRKLRERIVKLVKQRDEAWQEIADLNELVREFCWADSEAGDE